MLKSTQKIYFSAQDLVQHGSESQSEPEQVGIIDITVLIEIHEPEEEGVPGDPILAGAEAEEVAVIDIAVTVVVAVEAEELVYGGCAATRAKES